MGGLIVLGLVSPGAERRDIGETMTRSKGSAAASVGLLIVTGLYSDGLQVASPDALLSTTYWAGR